MTTSRLLCTLTVLTLAGLGACDTAGVIGNDEPRQLPEDCSCPDGGEYLGGMVCEGGLPLSCGPVDPDPECACPDGYELIADGCARVEIVPPICGDPDPDPQETCYCPDGSEATEQGCADGAEPSCPPFPPPPEDCACPDGSVWLDGVCSGGVEPRCWEPEPEPEGCEGLEGSGFTTQDLFDCGQLAGDPGCPSHLWFGPDGQFTWLYSDVGQGGTYACSDGTITTDIGYTASYDPVARTVEWDGATYYADP